MSDQLISLAIQEISPADFELWTQKVLTTVEDYQFQPTGGVHDGGQDGFIRLIHGQPEHYVQISKQKDFRSKIWSTINDLKKKARELKKLTFVTSQPVPERDLYEAKWGKELGVKLTIHDLKWLQIQASLNDLLLESLYGYNRVLIDGLQKASSAKKELGYSDRLSIITYLEAQANSLPASEDFQNLCLDTLIYDCLAGTDPEKEIFKNLGEIEANLSEKSKSVVEKAPVSVSDRLGFLCSKNNFPRIRRHSGDRFALPYEVRNQFDDGNVAIRNCEDNFIRNIDTRIDAECGDRASELKQYVIPAVRHAVIETFTRQAMNFVSSFSEISSEPQIEVHSIIERYFEEEDAAPRKMLEVCQDAASNVFRKICFSSNEEEREYLELLMKYFSVKFVMDGDIAVTQYFSEMATRLKIYLGTDIIVRCLSETFVRPESRGMTNALKKLQSAGVKLNITRQVLNEVFSHIHATYLTFKNDYEGWYRLGDLEAARHCDRILIRAFFYAYFEPEGHIRKPRDWNDFLNHIGIARWFSDPKKHMDDFGSFLLDKYNFEFMELGDLVDKIDGELAKKIAEDILEQRNKENTSGSQILALNDAQMALFINAEREANNERVSNSLYGYDTWWMTEETRILRLMKNYGQHNDVVMHPQFLINHYMLDPRRRRSNASESNPITPTLFGLRITDRVSPQKMKKFLKSVGKYAELDEAAARARIRSATIELKKARANSSTAEQAA